ncbi:resolvase/recombinase protein [Rhizobium phaseoli]|uniref:recombinase family protein n=1 Tax=Rhizobium phaseoli TaxID=396 RepID=UPI0007F0B7D9|nr:recombinase family protein [Rhizobium phaseoli]ANL70406.1 resolvase/recombinase protein [Rhizobium phaseoli]
MKPKAYSYIRMSTDVQLKGDSLRRQTEESKHYCEENGLELIEDFKLQDIGVSAYHGKNVAQGALGKFLALCEQQLIPSESYLIVESLDRISRQNPQAATALFLQILQAGINIVTLTDRHVYRAGSGDFTDIIVSVVIMSRAYEESRTKSLRVSAAWENKRQNIHQKKLTQVAPIWLRLSLDRTVFEVVPERVAIVRWIFDQAAQGKGSLQISRGLNQQRVPTFATSKGWHESYVSKVLTNRAVLGEFQPHRYIDGKRTPYGDPIPGYYPAIVAREQFERIQAGRAVRRVRGAGRKGHNNINLFQGVATCGYCNSRMMIINKGSGPKGGVYIRCDRARRGADCSASSWPLEHFEGAFLWFVEELDLGAVIDGAAGDEARKALEGKAAVISSDIEMQKNLRERAFDLLRESTSAAAFVRTKIDEASMKIDALERELAAVREAMIVATSGQKRPLEEVRRMIKEIGRWQSAESDSRSRVADWIKRNVKELLIFSDGLDPFDLLDAKRRQFSVTLPSGEFRTIQTIGNDPTVAAYSVHANDDRWALAEDGTLSIYT